MKKTWVAMPKAVFERKKGVCAFAGMIIGMVMGMVIGVSETPKTIYIVHGDLIKPNLKNGESNES